MSCSVNAMLNYSSVEITCGCLTLWKKKDLNFPMFSRWIWKTQSQAHLNKTQKFSLQIDKEAPLLIWKWGCSKQKSSRSNFFPNQVTDHNHCSVFAIQKVTFCDDSGTCMSSALRWVTLKQITWQFKEAFLLNYYQKCMATVSTNHKTRRSLSIFSTTNIYTTYLYFLCRFAEKHYVTQFAQHYSVFDYVVKEHFLWEC